MSAPAPDEAGGYDPDRPVIRDKRRIDPVTGTLRPGAPAPGPGRPGAPASPAAQPGAQPVPQTLAMPPEVAALENQLAERTADLQRVKAEYDNYRRRVERDRLAVAEQALASVLLGLLPVLDDIGRAREHGELEGGFKSVAESLEATTSKLGLQVYGQVGDPFDPVVHEALMHSYSAEVSEPTCVQVLQPGYRLGERILRPARVAVAEPETPPETPVGSTPEPRPAAESGAPAEGSSEAADEHA